MCEHTFLLHTGKNLEGKERKELIAMNGKCIFDFTKNCEAVSVLFRGAFA